MCRYKCEATRADIEQTYIQSHSWAHDEYIALCLVKNGDRVASKGYSAGLHFTAGLGYRQLDCLLEPSSAELNFSWKENGSASLA